MYKETQKHEPFKQQRSYFPRSTNINLVNIQQYVNDCNNGKVH